MHLNSQILGAMKTFEAAARLNSFSQAAKELSITPGAVSQQIRNLESQLDVPLFYRQARQVCLTVQGQLLFDTVRPLLTGLETCLGRIKQSALTEHVRLRSTPSFVFNWLIPRLGSFRQRYPDIRIETFAEESLLNLEAQDFDIAIDYGRGEYPGLEAKRMMGEWLLPVLSPELFSDQNWQDRDALNHAPLLHDSQPWAGADPDSEWRYFLEQAGLQGVDTDRGYYFNRSDMALRAAVSGLGVAIARESLLNDEITRGRLIAPFGKQRSCCSYYIVHAPGALEKPGVRAVYDWLLMIARQPDIIR